MKTVLFITQYFFPETEIGGIRIWEIARILKIKGYHIKILTGMPNYPEGKLFKNYERKVFLHEVIDGLDVYRSWLIPSHDKNVFHRAANYLTFCFSATIMGLFLGKADYVVATSPPITTSVVGYILSKVKGARLVTEIRDLWPESLIEMGYLNNRILQRLFYSFEKFIYKKSWKIVGNSHGIVANIVARSIPRDKTAVITNGIDIEMFKPGHPNKKMIEWKGSDLLGIYLGTISTYHGFDLVTQFLKELQKFPNIKIAFVGSGSSKEYLEEAIKENNFNNVKLYPPIKRDEMPDFLSAADFGLVFVRESKFSRWLISSKIFMYMANQLPIYGLVSGETADIINNNSLGKAFPPDSQNINLLIETLVNAKKDNRFGQNGRNIAINNFSWQAIGKKYYELMTDS